MSAKRFGAVALTANAAAKVMKARPGCDSTANVCFCNQTESPARISLAYVADPQDECVIMDSEYMLSERLLEPYGMMELRGIAVEENHQLVARSSISGVSVVAYGFEEEANWQ